MSEIHVGRLGTVTIRDLFTQQAVGTDIWDRPRVGAFRAPLRVVHASAALNALQLARDGITQVFESYGCDVRPDFDRLEAALNQAVYENPID